MSKEDFYDLTPDEVMNALERSGFSPTGQFTQLNSYENRVFDIRLEPDSYAARREMTRVVAKFYRPGRWSGPTILEEHQFLADLATVGLPVVAPLKLKNGETLEVDSNIWFAVFPRAMGRMIDEFQVSDFTQLGRTLAHMHNIGGQKQSKLRPVMTAENYGFSALEVLEKWVAPEVRDRYLEAGEQICERLDELLSETQYLRIHGDCHRGNILKTDAVGDKKSEFFFVDFDDCCMGPAVQDFWMLLSDSENSDEGGAELDALLEGYTELRNFDESELELIPALRGLRIIHYAGWIARRWEDPSFPRLFPQFRDYNYWASETEALEKISRLL